MNDTINKYMLEETSEHLSFRPFQHHRTKLKWYVLAILLFGGLSAYSYHQMNEITLMISLTFLIFTSWFFLKEVLFYIPMRYTFDCKTNAVYQGSLFVSQKKIMNLDEVSVFQSSEMGSWQYRLGKKKSQFVKSYAISEYFGDRKDDKKIQAYESEILNKIDRLVSEINRV